MKYRNSFLEFIFSIYSIIFQEVDVLVCLNITHNTNNLLFLFLVQRIFSVI